MGTIENQFKCSVIIPTYNRVELLRYTLSSIANQTLSKEEFEVIVVDDGSKDEPRCVIDEFQAKLNLRYFYQEDKGYRVAKARNIGIDAAIASICVFIDSGVVLGRECLEAHVSNHEVNDDERAVLGMVYGFNEDNEDHDEIMNIIDLENIDTTLNKLDTLGKYLDLREEFYAKYGESFNHLPAPWLMFWSGNASVKTKHLRSVRGFDESFVGWGGEDVELGLRLHGAGLRFEVERNAKSVHYPHDKSYQANMRCAVKNYEYIHKKHNTPVTKLLPDTHFFVLNDLL